MYNLSTDPAGWWPQNVRLVDHPDYRAPKLTATWCMMLPRSIPDHLVRRSDHIYYALTNVALDENE
jgi:hypothetical protein